jgi:uroporphyrinogen decarboxylase
VQGNLDPITLFAPEPILETRVKQVLAQAAGRPGHIFNLGHGIVPGTPVESVQAVVRMVKAFSPIYAPKSVIARVSSGSGEVSHG